MKITATYSPEDNKLRLYPSQRLDAETYAKVKAAGYKWAPKQGLFVAPRWTVAREDLAIELAGEIEAEESTMAERAAAKADRLEALAGKRRADANRFQNAARDISKRFEFGQPILVGHHSERRARKDREKMDANMRKAIEADKAAGWWLYKAEGAQQHANHKNRDDVRARRIKTLLSELRDLQRRLNHAAFSLKILNKAADADMQTLAGARTKEGGICDWDAWGDLDKGKRTAEQVRLDAIEMHESTLESPNLRRWIEHILNRLGYERELLGQVARWDGEVAPVMLQEFVREHGGDTPKGRREDDGRLTVSCIVPLPAHIGEGNSLTLTGDEWADLMQACGYEAKAKAAAKAAKSSRLDKTPLLNLDIPDFKVRGRYSRGTVETYRVHRMTKAEYMKEKKEWRYTKDSICGRFKLRCIVLFENRNGFGGKVEHVAVFLTDSKKHDAPSPLQEPVNA